MSLSAERLGALVGLSADFDERVYQLVESIPAGKVLNYGAIAEILAEGGPRNVGRAMSISGGVPWWRVVRADGAFPRCDTGEAIEHYAAEGTPLRPGGTSVEMVQALWQGPFGVLGGGPATSNRGDEVVYPPTQAE